MQRYFAKACEEEKFLLNPDDYYHIATVMRMTSADKVEVVYDKQVYLCKLEVQGKQVSVIKEKMLEQISDFCKEIVLLVPLLKESKMDYILQKATELGVSKIIPVVMERSVVKLEKTKESKRLERWTRICKEASEQSMRVTIPVITEVKTWKEVSSLEGAKGVCSTKEKKNTLKMFLQYHKSYDRIIIVVGPEGGLTNEEEVYLNGCGFSSVTLGPRIMRVETVPLFVLSAINYECME